MPKMKPQRPVRKQKNRPGPRVATNGARTLKKSEYKSFRLHRRIKPDLPPIVGAFRLLGRSLLVLKRHWVLFLGISLVYGFLNLLLVHGLASNGQLGTLKSAFDTVFKGSNSQLTSGLTLFVYLLGGSSNANATNANAGMYQVFLVILVSLALIWSLRQVYNNQKVRIRDGFYRGMYPLVPVMLVLFVMTLQLIPLAIGAYLYATVLSNGLAVGALEKTLWAIVFGLLALLSLYMIASSTFALYVATLEDMEPMKALRSARALVRYRRWTVLRKVLFLPIALVLGAAIIMIPSIIWLTAAAEWIYFGLTIVGLAIIHSYMYALYRELLPHE